MPYHGYAYFSTHHTGRCEGDYYCAFKKRQLLCVLWNSSKEETASFTKEATTCHESSVVYLRLFPTYTKPSFEDDEGEQKITMETLELAHKVTFYPLFTLALLYTTLFISKKGLLSFLY